MLSTNHNILFKATILALCVISFVHIFLFPLYDMNGANRNFVAKTYMDFEQRLCADRTTKKQPLTVAGRRQHRRHHCPQYGIVTSPQGGRLGNQMWEYASVWATARRTGLEPYAPRCMLARLTKVFESLSMPSFDDILHCHVEPGGFVKSLNEWNYTNQSILLPRYTFHVELVLSYGRDIVQEFQLRASLKASSQRILMRAAQHLPDRVFVGVHVRRTDYLLMINKYKLHPATASFYKMAMLYFERRYSNVVFIVVSDDPKWCNQTFKYRLNNVFITGKEHQNSPALDLAILASCNHSIIDYGTFGEWGAILAGGETIYFNISKHSTSKVGHYLSNWYTISEWGERKDIPLINVGNEDDGEDDREKKSLV